MTYVIGVTELEEREDVGLPPMSTATERPMLLVCCELGPNYFTPADENQRRAMEVWHGQNLVDSLATNPALWVTEAECPWTRDAELLVQKVLPGGDEGRRWLLGVMKSLREGKRNQDPMRLAAGFLVLSQMLRVTLDRWMPGVNFGYTCNEGCKLGGVIAKAAGIARQRLGYAAA